MNTYDFDKTVFNPDSSCLFFLYCLRRYPKTRRHLPKTAWAGIKFALKRLDTKSVKEQVFSFLTELEDVDGVVKQFWNEKFADIEQWYLKQKREDDIIISASPEFLLEPVCKRLGVRLIGTPMDKHTGRINGENCHDREKVRRFYEQYPEAHSERFYSDSLSDTPMAEISDEAFLVKRDKISPWPKTN